MFKKKLLKTLVSTTMAFVLATTPMISSNPNLTAIAAEADSNGFVIEDGVLTSYQGNGGAIEIPNTVTKIGTGAFSGCTQITSVTIPGSVTVIDERAFYGCSGVQSVTVTSGLKSIEKWAFYGCSSLTGIELPEGLERIAGLAFYNCSSLKGVIIPQSVSEIGASAFSAKSTDDFIIYGYARTTAETYAKNNDIEFEEIGSDVSKDESTDSEVSDKYIIKIWDPNDAGVYDKNKTDASDENGEDTFDELVIKSDFSEAKFSKKHSWNTEPKYTYMKYALTNEASKNSYDETNIQEYFERENITAEEGIKKQNLSKANQNIIKKKRSEEQTVSEEYMILRTNYMNFTVTRSDGSHAVVEDGNKVEGNLDVSFYEIWNEYGEEYDVEFLLPALNSGERYSITPKQSQKSHVSSDKELDFYKTKLSLRASYGYYAKVTSEKPVTLIVSDDGNMETKTENGEAVAQTLKTAFDDPARMIEGASSTIIQGIDSGFSINSENKNVQIQSDNQVPVDVIVNEKFQSLDMGTVSTESGTVTVSAGENSYAITDANGKELVRKEIGYLVRFNLLTGQDMQGLENVPYGSLISEPQNITREGYTFEGWYTSRNFEENTKWDFSVNTVTSDVDLYAKWVEIPKEPLVFIDPPTPTPRVTPMPMPTGSQIVTESPTVEPTKEPATTTTKSPKPSKVTLKNSAKKTLKVTWKKVSKATGYKVVYSTNKKFSKSKTKTVIVKNAKNSVTIKKLKKGKTYYVKVCAYNKSGKTTVYGKYSTVKKVKIKK